MTPERGPRIAVAAVGFDLGETLYHFGRPPLSWIERGRAVRPGRRPGARRSARGGDAAGRLVLALGPRGARRAEATIDRVAELVRQSLVPYPDAVATLAALKRAGFLVGALTNVPWGLPRATVRRDLERMGLSPFIDRFVSSSDAGARKPDPAAFAWLAATLGVAPGQIAYVGNLVTDVIGARAAGCIPIFLDRSGSGADHGQVATIRRLDELPGLLTRPDG